MMLILGLEACRGGESIELFLRHWEIMLDPLLGTLIPLEEDDLGPYLEVTQGATKLIM